MKKRKDHPLYQECVELYLKRSPKFTKARLSKNLNRIERTLLEARQENRSNNFIVARDLLSTLSTDSIFLEAEKNFILASTYFNLGKYENAIESNLASLKEFQKIQDRRGSFLCSYNLSVDFQKLRLDSLSSYYLKEAESYSKTVNEKVLIYRAIACELSLKGEHLEAVKYIQMALSKREEHYIGDQRALDCVAIDIYLQAGHLDLAIKQSNALCTVKKFCLKPRYVFENMALKFIASPYDPGTPLKTLEENSEYLLKWEILRSLFKGDRERARKLWRELQSILPQRYRDDFEPMTDAESKGVFIRALFAVKKPVLNSYQAPSPFLKGKLADLHGILTQSKFPLRKEEIIENIWKVPYSNELDSRFYKLVERLKKSANIDIVYKAQGYSISN